MKAIPPAVTMQKVSVQSRVRPPEARLGWACWTGYDAGLRRAEPEEQYVVTNVPLRPDPAVRGNPARVLLEEVPPAGCPRQDTEFHAPSPREYAMLIALSPLDDSGAAMKGSAFRQLNP